MFFDSHAHYDDEAFDEDRYELLDSFPENNIDYIVNASSNMNSSELSVELSNKYRYIYATIGVHPNEVQNLTENDIDILENMYRNNNKVVAIGEIGIDYHYGKQNSELQKYWFKNQLNLAKKLNLPVVIHSRDAAQECFDIIKESCMSLKRNGVIHCYSSSAEMAFQYIDMGFYIGIGGVLTFNNSKKTAEVVEKIPISKILIETDSPYLSPVPNRGKRNDSRNLIYIVEKIAQIKQMDVNKVAKVTCENAKAVFNI